jgi:hypothetical protein
MAAVAGTGVPANGFKLIIGLGGPDCKEAERYKVKVEK